MYDNSSLMLLHALTSTHAGSGTELSYIDLPIQRETHTGFPKIEASTLKGCIQAAHSKPNDELASAAISQLFGSSDNGDLPSALSFTDARLLFFPVKSVIGIFAWVTCPYVLARFQTDFKLISDSTLPAFTASGSQSIVTTSSKLLIPCPNADDQQIMLEDYTFTVTSDQGFTALVQTIGQHLFADTALADHFDTHAVLLSDDDFASFVKYSTEVNTRIKINPKTGTVVEGALFTEEFLPPESILYSMIFYHAPYASPSGIDTGLHSANDVKLAFQNHFPHQTIFQIGANTTLGKGMVQSTFWEVSADAK